MRGSNSPPPSLFLRRIREAAGPSVKSAFSHTFTRDTRDDPFASTRGSFLKLKQVGSGSLSLLCSQVGGCTHTRLFVSCTRSMRGWVAMRTLSRRSRKARSRAGLEVVMFVLCFERAI